MKQMFLYEMQDDADTVNFLWDQAPKNLLIMRVKVFPMLILGAGHIGRLHFAAFLINA